MEKISTSLVGKKITQKDLSLYIHIPFCKTICVYCNFLTFAHKNKQIPEYLQALQKEITAKAEDSSNYLIKTIYFGGGTPSLLEAEQLGEIIKSIQQHFQVQKSCEMTVECNPENLTSEKLSLYKQYRVTRISLGVQSLNPRTLMKVARPHDDKTIFKALECLKETQWKNFGMDVIMGLPYQTLNEFKEHLEKLLSYHPAHFSAYFLSYDTRKIDLFINEIPDESIQIKMYQHLIKKLAQEGFIHYEVSNYARPGFQCEHNLRYWEQKEYLGLGLGAHSYTNNKVSENTRNFETYLKNQMLYEDQYELDQETQRMDYIMLNLRKAEGLNLKTYREKFGEKEYKNVVQKASQYNNELKIKRGTLAATEKGWLILDKITRDLL